MGRQALYSTRPDKERRQIVDYSGVYYIRHQIMSRITFGVSTDLRRWILRYPSVAEILARLDPDSEKFQPDSSLWGSAELAIQEAMSKYPVRKGA
jgi:hypothetical protein